MSGRRAPLRGLLDRSGAAALEFALCAPVLCLIMAGAVDLGLVLYAKFKLDAAVSAASNYAMLNSANVNSTSGANLANTLGTIVSTSQGGVSPDAAIVVNAGPSDTVSGGVSTAGGTASKADSCYCPTGSASQMTWGSALTCGTSCPSGGYAGKFVTIVASRSYKPIFSSYGIVQNGTISVGATAQVQ